MIKVFDHCGFGFDLGLFGYCQYFCCISPPFSSLLLYLSILFVCTLLASRGGGRVVLFIFLVLFSFLHILLDGDAVHILAIDIRHRLNHRFGVSAPVRMKD